MKLCFKGSFRNFVFRFGMIALSVFILSLTGCGGGGSSNSNNDDGNVVTPNEPPVANATAPAVVDEQTSVTLDGTGSTDSDGNITSYSWTQLSGPAVNITNANADVAQFVAPAVSAPTDVSFRLTVTDNDGASDTDDVTVNVDNAQNLSGSASTPPDQVNLTTEGVLDWSHWGLNTTELNQKAGVIEEIGDYVQIGAITPSHSTGSPTAFSWSDGVLPDDVVDDTTTRVIFVTPNLGIDEGVELTVPAGTAEKTLKVYVGAFSAKGRFAAWLGDPLADPPDYEVFLDNPGELFQKIWVVTVNFGAAAGGTLTIQYTLDEDTGVAGGHINLAAATLTDATVATPTISPAGGTFTDSVEVTLVTATPNAVIRYTVDGTDPDNNSTLYTGPFTLSTVGTINLKARAFVSGLNDSDIAEATFTINASAGGSLSAFVSTPPDLVNLTTEGVLDWSHWGLNTTELNQKDIAIAQIGDYVDIGTVTPSHSSGSPSAFSWSDGVLPDDVVDDTTTRVIFVTPNLGIDEGVELTVPAGIAEKTLKVYVGAL
jgi:hypothetical protein